MAKGLAAVAAGALASAGALLGDVSLVAAVVALDRASAGAVRARSRGGTSAVLGLLGAVLGEVVSAVAVVARLGLALALLARRAGLGLFGAHDADVAGLLAVEAQAAVAAGISRVLVGAVPLQVTVCAR